MTTAPLLTRLEQVKATGPGRWIARCPAHEDRHPSLAIRALDNGRILLHCFAGCPVHEITQALGLDLRDLFPASSTHHRTERRPWVAADVLKIIYREVLIVLIGAEDIAAGQVLSDEDHERVRMAVARIRGAIEGAGYVA
jgi:hypothetical protein